MNVSTEFTTTLTSLFEQQPCWMIEPLSRQIHYSIPSTRRFLTQAGYYSSFTHNGRWYTLRSIPRFSQQGLWFFGDIGFSKAGSLTRTLVALIEASRTGMSAEQLGQTLRCRCHSVLVGLYRKGLIDREHQGRSHIYLAADPKTAEAQRRAEASAEVAILPAEIAVMVLAEFIRKPSMAPAQLARRVSGKTGVLIDADQIQALFKQHGIKKMLPPLPYVS